MDLKFTFEDDSEAIAHYGVKGQKWGKRKANVENGVKSSLGVGNTRKRVKNSRRVRESKAKFKNKDLGKFGSKIKAGTNYRSSGGLTAGAARKNASVNAEYKRLKEQKKMRKMYGYK